MLLQQERQPLSVPSFVPSRVSLPRLLISADTSPHFLRVAAPNRQLLRDALASVAPRAWHTGCSVSRSTGGATVQSVVKPAHQMRTKPFLQNLKDYVGFTDQSTQILQSFHATAAPHFA